MKSVYVLAFAAAFAVFGATACNSDAPFFGFPCTTDEQCPVGSTCVESTCTVVLSGDTSGDAVSFDVSDDDVTVLPDAGDDAGDDVGDAVSTDAAAPDTGGDVIVRPDTGPDSGSDASTCQPSCDGLQCGNNGCGGVCGVCGDGAVCAAGRCELDTAPSECSDVLVCASGCADFNCLLSCADAADATGRAAAFALLECAADRCSEFVDATPQQQIACARDACPSEYGACTGGACVPQCSGRTCGDDGCGGSCGTCGSGGACSETGQCEDLLDCGELYNCIFDCGDESEACIRACEGRSTTTARNRLIAAIGCVQDNCSDVTSPEESQQCQNDYCADEVNACFS